MTSGVISAEISAWVVYGVLVAMETITYLSTTFIPDTERHDDDDKESR